LSVTEAGARRIPQQERSRERVEAILRAARDLIGSRGNDAVSMREIAACAGIPIGSVYQYFKDKNAILRRLMEGYLGDLTAQLGAVLDEVEDVEQLPAALDAMVDVVVRLFREKKEFPTIWAAAQANTVLRELDAGDGRRIADYLVARLQALVPTADPDDIRGASLHAVHTIGTTVRVALLYSTPHDRDLLLHEFKTLLRLRLESIVPGLRQSPL
jgi:AcrR family transcriptional regulator